MKPNLIFVQPAHVEINDQIEMFCEHFCDTHYVYLIRPNSEFRDDSPSGLRFLNNPLNQLPGFSDVDTVVSVADMEVAALLTATYPTSKLAVWNPEEETQIPEILVNLLKPTVILGNFGAADGIDLARAM